MTKEPVAYINAAGVLLVGLLPVIAAFGLLNWSIEQFGIVEAFIVLVVGTVTTLFARSKVSPV